MPNMKTDKKRKDNKMHPPNQQEEELPLKKMATAVKCEDLIELQENVKCAENMPIMKTDKKRKDNKKRPAIQQEEELPSKKQATAVKCEDLIELQENLKCAENMPIMKTDKKRKDNKKRPAIQQEEELPSKKQAIAVKCEDLIELQKNVKCAENLLKCINKTAIEMEEALKLKETELAQKIEENSQLKSSVQAKKNKIVQLKIQHKEDLLNLEAKLEQQAAQHEDAHTIIYSYYKTINTLRGDLLTNIIKFHSYKEKNAKLEQEKKEDWNIIQKLKAENNEMAEQLKSKNKKNR